MAKEIIPTKSVFREDFENMESISDCRIRTEDGYVYNVHRYILGKRSKYFYAAFYGINPNRTDILIPGVKGAPLGIVIRYICTNEIVFTSDNVSDVLITSDYLSVDDLFLEAKTYAINNLSVDNCCMIFRASLDMNLQDLQQQCFRFIQIHFKHLVKEKTSKLELLPVDKLKELIWNEDAYVRNYADVIWSSITRWIEYDTVHRQVHLTDLLICMNFDHINEDTAFSIVEHNLVAENPSCNNLKILKRTVNCKTYVGMFTLFFRNLQTHDYGLKYKNSLFYFITNKNVKFWMEGCKDCYITYDGHFDYWRKVTEMPFIPDFLLFIGQFVYATSFSYDDLKVMMYGFDFIENIWNPFENLTVEVLPYHKLNYFAVVHEGSIYILCGTFSISDVEVPHAFAFNFSLKVWNSLEPPIPIYLQMAVSFGGKIYAIGFTPRQENQILRDEIYIPMTQVYDPQLDTWTLLPAPNFGDRIFDFIAFRNKIYLIKKENRFEYGTIFVDAFDPNVQQWQNLPNLPYIYNEPKAIILKDRLIVYENDPTCPSYVYLYKKPFPPVCLNVESESWETYTDLSISNYFHQYTISALEDYNVLKTIHEQSRDENDLFVRSPFN